MVECLHAKVGSNTPANESNQKQGPLRDSPLVPPRTLFIYRHHAKGNHIDSPYIQQKQLQHHKAWPLQKESGAAGERAPRRWIEREIGRAGVSG